jgi:hypothetical protein
MEFISFEKHPLVKIITENKGFIRYAAKYNAPLEKYRVPSESILKQFFAVANCEDIAYYYLAIQNCGIMSIPGILASLEKHHGFNIPLVDGILSPEFWENWQSNHIIDIMDFAKFWREYKKD